MARPKCTRNSSQRELRSLSLYLRIDSSVGSFGFLKRANNQFPPISTANITTKKANTPKPTSIADCIMRRSTDCLLPRVHSGQARKMIHKEGRLALYQFSEPLNRLCFIGYFWGGRRGLNPRHSVPQTDALPAELLPPLTDNKQFTLLFRYAKEGSTELTVAGQTRLKGG